MLLLSRRRGEGITIDGHICLQVSSISGSRVLFAISAPPSVRICRSEKQVPSEPTESRQAVQVHHD
jgi:carbon storage regulator CsrA